jgi:hypothetical protein
MRSEIVLPRLDVFDDDFDSDFPSKNDARQNRQAHFILIAIPYRLAIDLQNHFASELRR